MFGVSLFSGIFEPEAVYGQLHNYTTYLGSATSVEVTPSGSLVFLSICVECQEEKDQDQDFGE